MKKTKAMQDLLILGAGVHAGEMVEIVERVNRVKKTWNLLGFIATDEKQVGTTLNGLPVLGTKDVMTQYPKAFFVPDNNWPRTETVPTDRLISLLDPSVFVSRTARIGKGCVFYPGCYIGLNATIGDYVFCLGNCVINHDDVIENRSVLATSVTLAGFVKVEPDCYLGQACTIRQYLTIGRHSLIGMGAVVVKNVEPDSVMAGNPARKIKSNLQ